MIAHQSYGVASVSRAGHDESGLKCGAAPKTIDGPKHMGVIIEIVENTPGVMVARRWRRGLTAVMQLDAVAR